MKKLYICVLSLLVIVFAVSGTAVSAGWYREDRTVNRVSIGSLKGRITEEYEQGTVVMPGDGVGKVVRIENTGLSDGIVRVRIEPFWNDTGEVIPPEILELEAGGEGWKYDASDGYYYYLDVLSPGRATTPVMTGFSLDGPAADNPFAGRPGGISVHMEMVQAEADGTDLWGKDAGALNIDYSSLAVFRAGPETEVAFRGPEEGFVFGAGSGDLFAGFKNILPGVTRSQDIVLKNEWKDSAEIYLRAAVPSEYVSGGQQGQSAETDEELRLGELREKLLKDHTAVNIYCGGEHIYSGPLWGDGGDDAEGLFGSGVCLGSFGPGNSSEIYVELAVDKAVDNDYMGLSGAVDWFFSASAGEPVPETGDRSLTGPVIVALCSGSAAVILALGRLISGRRGKRAAGAMLFAVPVLFSAAILTALSGTMRGTLAFMTDSETADNTVSAGKLSLELEEPGFVPEVPVAPGDHAIKDPFVRNTGTVPMLAYLSVTVPLKTVRLVGEDGISVSEPQPAELFGFSAGEGWSPVAERKESGPDGEFAEYVYGYLEVLAPGETTLPLFEEVVFADILEGDIPGGTLMNIHVKALGIQADNIAPEMPAEDRLIFVYETFLAPGTAETGN